jgi:hypothetical protein
MRKLFTILFIFSYTFCWAQNNTGTIKGVVKSEDDSLLKQVSVKRLEKLKGVLTNDSGRFEIILPAQRYLAVEFIKPGYKIKQRNIILNKGEVEEWIIVLEKDPNYQPEIIVSSTPRRTNEAGLYRINPSLALDLPTPNTSIESIIKILVGSNNELSNQYNVRGGSFDENLIYVNGFEIYKPYLIRNGQQEGLSFINPDMVDDIDFSTGGFQAKYGDKISSVLDVTYKKPKKLGGSLHLSLLEQGIHLEGISSNKKFTYLFGARNRNNRNLLSSQETKGNYVPSSNDIQGYFTYQLKPKWQLELQTNFAGSQFFLQPTSASKTATVYSPLFAANLGVDIEFEGRERDKYGTNMVGLALNYKKNILSNYKLLLSYFENNEQENFDITGAYIFGDREFDKSKPTFGLIVNPLGAGLFQNYARNNLKVQVSNATLQGQHKIKNNFLQWGNSIDVIKINDKLFEWERQDSGRYNVPFNTNSIQFAQFLNSTTQLNYFRWSGFLQNNILFGNKGQFSLQAGIRFNYTSLNKEFFVSPRAQLTYRPIRNQRMAWHLNLGIYNQPPFYREMRNRQGVVNTQLLAQRSQQAILGWDYNFVAVGRPFRVTAEAYYKNLTNVVPYDIDNVRLRYFATNNAKAYATGIEFRLNGELVKDAKSWVSLGIMKTEEDLNNDFFYKYINSDGQFITSATPNQTPVDSTKFNLGYLRRPSDRRVTFGLFFSDYLSTNKNFKVYLSAITGTNLPYSIPDKPAFRSQLSVPPYLRFDIGFSTLLLPTDKSKRRAYSPFKNFENIYASLEVFNLLDRANTISYLLIKDFSNTTYPIPNRLTPRLLNLKLVAKF